MKKLASALWLGALLLCGCAHRYVLTLHDGTQITSKGKPKVKNGAYIFKDVMGEDRVVPLGRVSEVAPASMTKQTTGTQFNLK